MGVPLFLSNFANSAHRRELAPSYECIGERVEFPCPGKREKVGGKEDVERVCVVGREGVERERKVKREFVCTVLLRRKEETKGGERERDKVRAHALSTE